MKIVVNRRNGGFGLSVAAIKRLYELQGKDCFLFRAATSKGPFLPASNLNNKDNTTCLFIGTSATAEESTPLSVHRVISDLCRSDPNLIQVVEELGDKANAYYSDLRVIEIPDGITYTIEDHAGYESIEEVHRSW